jgi:hypothetical protein
MAQPYMKKTLPARVFTRIFNYRAIWRCGMGQGYPPARSESRREGRGILKEISTAAHKDFVTILQSIDKKP